MGCIPAVSQVSEFVLVAALDITDLQLDFNNRHNTTFPETENPAAAGLLY